MKIKLRVAEIWECCSLVSGPYHHHDVQLANVVEGDRLRLPIPIPIRDQAAPILRHLLWQRQGASKVKIDLASKFWMIMGHYFLTGCWTLCPSLERPTPAKSASPPTLTGRNVSFQETICLSKQNKSCKSWQAPDLSWKFSMKTK